MKTPTFEVAFPSTYINFVCRHAMLEVLSILTDLNVISTDLGSGRGSSGCASSLSFDFEETHKHETTPRSGKTICNIE